jgi:hypothetical protein
MRRLTLIALALLWLGMAEAPVISLVRPQPFIAENFATEFRVRIPRNDDNRRVEVSAIDKADGERVAFSERPIDGGSPQLQVFKLILPRGSLTLTATLFGVHGQRGKVQAPVRVLSPSDRPDDAEPGADDPIGFLPTPDWVD